MTKKELMEYRGISIELQQLEEQIARLESALKSPKGQMITDMPKSGQHVDNMADKISKLLEYRESRDKLWDKLLERQKAVESSIDSLSNPIQRTIMRYRYIDGLSWVKVSERIHYSEYYVKKELHTAALREIENTPHNPTHKNDIMYT